MKRAAAPELLCYIITLRTGEAARDRLYAIRGVAFAVPNAAGVQEGAYIMLGAGFGLAPDCAGARLLAQSVPAPVPVSADTRLGTVLKREGIPTLDQFLKKRWRHGAPGAGLAIAAGIPIGSRITRGA